MADVITRLKLDSGEYDSKIKRATQGLLQMEQECRKVGGTLAILEKDQKQYVQSLGQMETVSKTARGKLSELTAAFTELSIQYKRLTDEEKKGDYGKALSASLDQLKTRIANTKKDLQDVDVALGKTKDGFGKVETGGSNLSNILGELGSKFGVNSDLMGMVTTGSLSMAAGITAAAAAAGAAAKAFADYNSELSKQDQITSVTTGLKGGDAQKMTDAASSIAKIYGTDFREVINAANTLMTQFGQSGDSAIQLIRDGMQGMIQGDGPKLLSMIQQFAPSFRDAGISASQLVAIIQNSEGGIFTDQNMNAIVMGIKNIRLMTDATSQSLRQVGIDGEEMKRKLNDGSMTIFQALRQVAQSIENTGSSSQAAGQVMQNVFGRQGAMAGTKLGEAIANLNTNLEETKTQTGGLGESLANLERAQESLNSAMRETFGMNGWEQMSNVIKSEVLTALADVVLGVKEVSRTIAEMPPYIKAMLTPASLLLDVLKNIGPEGKTAFMMIADFAGKTLNPLYAVLRALRLIGQEQRNIGNNGSGGSASGGGGGSTGRGGGGIRGGDDGTTPPRISLGGSGGGNRRTGRTGSNTPPPAPEGSIERQSQEIQKLQKAWRLAADDNSREKIKKQIEEMQADLDRMEGKNVYPLGSMAQINAMLSDIAAQQKLVTDPDDWQKLEAAAAKYRDELAKIKGTYVDPAEVKGNLQTTNLVVAPVSLGIDEKELKAFSKEIDDYFKKNPLGDAGKKVTSNWQDAAKAIQSVGSAMAGIEDPAAKVMGTIAQAIATMALSYAEASKQAAMNPANAGWGWIAFAATGLATMISSIAAIKSATSGFAQGGIVPGNSYSGDLLSTRDYGINSGELILNKAQQGIIASQLEGGGMQNMVLDTQISAEAIRIVLNNNGRRTRRGEYVTTKKYGS